MWLLISNGVTQPLLGSISKITTANEQVRRERREEFMNSLIAPLDQIGAVRESTEDLLWWLKSKIDVGDDM